VPRTLLYFAMLTVCAVPARADQTTSTPETLIRLTLSPAPAPKPALRYLLLPELLEMNPGNPIQNYFKCFMEHQKFFFDKDAFDRREKLLAMPLKELAVQELKDYGGFALKQADWAARLDTPDWQILLKLKTEGVSLMLPDVQNMRPLASALKVRLRAEVAVGRFDDSLRTTKTMFAMARHLGLHPTMIGELVGIAIAYITIGPLEEMLEQPGCPNLYWALTNLPNPLVSIDKGTEGERVLVLAEFRDLDESGTMNAEQLERFIAHMNKLLGEPGKPMSVRAWLDARTKDEEVVSAARRRLVEHGLHEEKLVRFSADQVLLLDEKREYVVRRDDSMKIMNLPAWQAEALAAQAQNSKKPPALFADVLEAGVYNIRKAQARLDQRIALLRHIEAIRLYLAEHNSSFPTNLSDLTLPLPVDPFTGKPFRYERTGKTAHLRGSPPAAEQNNANYNVHYELTVQE
jgi:hypothetical protein